MRIWPAVLLWLGASPQEVRLQPRAEVGSKATITVDSVLDLEILVKDGAWEAARESSGKAPSVAESPGKEDWTSARLLSVVRREKFAQEITRVSDGRPSAVELRCLSSTVQKSGTNLALTTSSTALAGRTFVATRTDLGWVVKDTEGRPAPPEGQSLGAWNDYGLLLPPGAVRVSDTWKVEAQALGNLFFPPGTTGVAGSLEGTLESVGGGRATVLLKGEMEGVGKDGSIRKVVLAGSRLVFDVTAGRPLLLTINGTFESWRSVTEEAAVLSDPEPLSPKKPSASPEGRSSGAPAVPAPPVPAAGTRRKLGEILTRSSRLEVSFVFE